MHLDPWHFALLLLTYTLPAAPTRWPTDRTLRHECVDDEPDATGALTVCEADALHHLEHRPLRAGELAVAMGVAPGTMHVRLHRMRKRGLIEGGRNGWRPAARVDQRVECAVA